MLMDSIQFPGALTPKFLSNTLYESMNYQHDIWLWKVGIFLNLDPASTFVTSLHLAKDMWVQRQLSSLFTLSVNQPKP